MWDRWKTAFVEKGKGKFYLGEKEPVKVAGINVHGFEIFKEQIVESLVWNNVRKSASGRIEQVI